jgi:hypothetical protein
MIWPEVHTVLDGIESQQSSRLLAKPASDMVEMVQNAGHAAPDRVVWSSTPVESFFSLEYDAGECSAIRIDLDLDPDLLQPSATIDVIPRSPTSESSR